jgi:hypothetical protein
LSSPVYLPLTAWLTQSAGWRGAIRVEAVTVGIAFVLAAAMIKNPGRSQSGPSVGRSGAVLRVAWRHTLVRAWLAATLIGGAAVNALIVYQVPVTTRAGLPLGIAAAVAGFRGLAQLAGRLPLTTLTSKLGTRTILALAYTLAAAVTLLLLLAGGALAPVLVLSLLAGAAIGAVYTLQGSTPTNSSIPATWARCSASPRPSSPRAAPWAPSRRARCWAPPAPALRRSRSSAPDSPPPACSCSAGHPPRPQPATPLNRTTGDSSLAAVVLPRVRLMRTSRPCGRSRRGGGGGGAGTRWWRR